MTTHNTQKTQLAELQSQIEILKAEIATLKETPIKKRGGKVKVEKVAKQYAGKQGHYFVLATSATCYPEMADRVTRLLEQEDFASKIRKSHLGRAMINQFETAGTLCFWSPNQDDLMFGPVLSGRNKATDAEIFVIPADQLQDLGKAFADDKAGKLAVEALVNLPGFLDMEKLQKEERKLQDQLNKLAEKNTK